MIGWLFSVVFAGIPAALGGYLVAKPNENRDRVAGFCILICVTSLALTFAWFIPHGKIITAHYQFKMPLCLLTGTLVGLVLGLRKR